MSTNKSITATNVQAVNNVCVAIAFIFILSNAKEYNDVVVVVWPSKLGWRLLGRLVDSVLANKYRISRGGIYVPHIVHLHVYNVTDNRPDVKRCE